ncbi:MAG: radical SAM family heme chaperone HemW [Thermomicrobiales bacterium]
MTVRVDAPRTELAPGPADGPVGVYLHIPFCAHICPYCDFNTYAGQGALIPRYVAALTREIERWAPRLTGRSIATVFLGGGTPSLLSPDQVASLIATCRAIAPMEPSAEITLEANPNGVDERYFTGLLGAGVTRLSIGVQTLSPRGLRRLGRLHEPSDAHAAFTAANAAGFSNLSADFIFGWPTQTLDDWERDLDVIANAELGGAPLDHVSLYSLIIEPGTPMADAVARSILSVPDDDAAADMYERAIERLGQTGWLHYEVANWARAEEVMYRHNRVYWRNADFIGAGAGAHGTVAGRRWMNQALPRTYIEAIEAGMDPAATREEIPGRTAMGETMMLGLRLLREGVDRMAFAHRHGTTLEDAFGPEMAQLDAEGLINRDAHGIRLTQRGLLLANDVCARFL